MKRACYEWTGASAALIAVVLAGYWGASLINNDVDFYLAFGDFVHVKAADGVFTFCDHIANLAVIRVIDSGGQFTPRPVRSIG